MDGSRSPGAQWPLRMRERIASAICRCGNSAAPGFTDSTDSMALNLAS